MNLKLSRLEFDHANGSALHIRGDSETDAPDNVVALALSTTQARVTALAQFRIALEPGETPPAAIDIAADVVGPSPVLGDISSIALRPDRDGALLPVVLELPANQIQEAGIGRHQVEWQWRWRPSGSREWSSFDTTRRFVFVTLAPPSAPWSQATDAESQRRWPWIRLLEHACGWAKGVTMAAGLDAAARKVSSLIEAGVYDLGRQNLLTYGGGAFASLINGSTPVFKLSKFLRVLERQPRELPMDVYCTECAVAVAVTANCLGTDLTLLKVQRRDYSTMDLNRVWAIGTPRPKSPPFIFHEVTVLRNPTGRKHVFDACLQTDWNTDRRSDKAKFDLARGRRLGAPRLNPDSPTYLHRLLAPREILWENLDLPESAMPHLEFRSANVQLGDVDDRVKAGHRGRIDDQCRTAGVDDSAVTCDAPARIPQFQMPGFHVYKEFDAAHLAELRPLVTAYAAFAYTVNRRDLAGEDFDRDRRFRISVAWSPDPLTAREALAWLMAGTDHFLQPFRRAGNRKLGHAAFATPDQRMIFILRNNMLTRLVSTGNTLIRMGAIAERVDRALLLFARAPRQVATLTRARR